jgi:hypothetical protein
MESPFNFPMQLMSEEDLNAAVAKATGTEAPETGDAETPASLTILEARPSASRRGGYKVTLGFKVAGQAVPLLQHRLDLN